MAENAQRFKIIIHVAILLVYVIIIQCTIKQTMNVKVKHLFIAFISLLVKCNN